MVLYHDRRAVCGSLLATVALAMPADAKVDSVNPANNYYFPMAKYRYTPRILRAWIAVDELAPGVLDGSLSSAAMLWDDMEIIWYRLDDATTAMPLFTNAVEGSRSTKRKTKSDTQKSMASDTKAYTEACKLLRGACDRRDAEKARAALAKAKSALGEYRVLAKIDGPDGGMITPENTAEGRGGVPNAQYVIPVFSGGTAMNREDFRKLR